MRFAHITLAAMATLTLTAAPVAAQSTPTPTMQESIECMLTAYPFLMVATVNNPDAVVELKGSAEFWADYGDVLGDVSDSDMAAAEEKGMAMIDSFSALESEAEFPAYLAPYQATFDACEEMRKALQAG